MSTQSGQSIRSRTFEVIFGRASIKSRRFDTILLLLILASVCVVIIDSSTETGSAWADRLRILEIAFTLVFTVEYTIRLWCHPKPGQYARSLFGIIDFVAIIPTYLAFIVPGWETLAVLRVLRVLRILRILELGRFSRAAELIGSALGAARYKIGVFATIVMLVVVIAGALMYMLEGPENGFSSIPVAAYWAIATLTTVGHPELIPATPLGQALASFIMVLGYAFIAIPVGIITSEVLAAQNTLKEVLDAEEGERLEYKSSAYYSFQDQKTPESVIFHASVLKPVAGFLNGKGGTLAIGVRDDREVIGVEQDLEYKKWDIDKYVRSLTSAIITELGGVAGTMTTISIREYEGRKICFIEIQRSPDPIYMKTTKNPETFYVRINNSTRELTGPNLVAYVRKRWN